MKPIQKWLNSLIKPFLLALPNKNKNVTANNENVKSPYHNKLNVSKRTIYLTIFYLREIDLFLSFVSKVIGLDKLEIPI